MSVISMVLVVIVAFLAGMEGVLDEFQFHQPLVACTLIGLVTGQLVPCIILGGSLQMIALGWANIGAAVAPDAALAAVASAIILVQGGQGRAGVDTAIAVAIPLAVAGLFLTMIVRTLSVICVHQMDAAAAKGSFKGVEAWHIIAVCLQGIRIAIPAAALLAIPSSAVAAALNSMPAWLTDGMSIGGGMVVAVGYAMVINMMATKEVWPFFAIGFCLAAVSDLTLIALGVIAVSMALIYLKLSENAGSGNGGSNTLSVALRSTFLQGSWNYERMQNGGWCFAMIPAIKKLYTTKEDQIAALKRHLEFFNTHPYVASPVIGVTLALEEDKANGAPVEDSAIQGVKVGMMGPLAGVGDPVFWFTARPILGALGASLAMGGSILGPILFFVLWNVIRWAFMWYTQEFGYNVGTKITEDLSGGLLQKVTKGASILGMFVLGALIERWVSINFTPVVSKVTLSKGAYIDWAKLPAGAEGIKTALTQQASGMALDPTKVTTLQDNLNSLIPGFVPLLLTLLCMWLLKKNVSPIIIIIALFIVGIGGHVIGLL